MSLTSLPVRIFGVPMDLGQKRRGVDMGPSAIRYAELQRRLERLGYTVCDGGNIYAPIREQIQETEHTPEDGLAHNVPSIFRVCQIVYEHMKQSIAANETVISLGGDHSMAIGTVSAAIERPDRVGVLWIDAHGDFNTPQTTPSGNVHGMVVASLMGMGPVTIGERRLTPRQIAMIGIRDLDADEKIALSQSGIKVFTMRDIDENGMANVVRTALDALGDVGAIHISLDMDALDPQVASGVGTPVPGGLTYREAHLLMEILADDGRVRSLDVVEVNPILDMGNRTAEIAVELIASLFGQRIL
jgi:arginase